MTIILQTIFSTSTEKAIEDKSIMGNVCIGIRQVIKKKDAVYLNLRCTQEMR